MWARLLLRQASRRRTVPIAPEETVSGLLLEQLRRLRLKTLTTRARRDDCGPVGDGRPFAVCANEAWTGRAETRWKTSSFTLRSAGI